MTKTYTTPSGKTYTEADLRPQTRDEKLAITRDMYRVKSFETDTRFIEKKES